MIVWSGWGIIAPAIVAVFAIAGTGFGSFFGSPEVNGANWGSVVGLIGGGVALWFAGKRMNAPRQGFHPQTGQPVSYGGQHRLFWIPIEYWGPIVGVLALYFAFTLLTG